MQATETSFAFRKRVEDYQLERTSVGLPEIPDEELVIGILNRLDMARYTSLVKDYLDNERRGIAELPEHPATLWKEIKDTQVIRFRGIGGVNLHSVYLTSTDEAMREEADLEHSGRGRGRGRSSRGRGRGQGRGHGRGQGRGQGKGRERPASEPSTKYEPIKPADINCWNCGKKGHRSSACLTKVVHFTDAIEEANVFLATVQSFRPEDEDHIPDVPEDIAIFTTRAIEHFRPRIFRCI